MTDDEKLSAILAAVQTDPGNRGLAKHPTDNLFTATAGDFVAACRSMAENPSVDLYTGFIIPSAEPPTFETDGPLGAVFLWRMIHHLTGRYERIVGEVPVMKACSEAIDLIVGPYRPLIRWIHAKHSLWIERAGPASDGECYTMRGRPITNMLDLHEKMTKWVADPLGNRTIGIGDGGNEIGMGKIPHDTIVRNIPNGDLIHCRVPTDYLIVAGVSNWGAYALAAGVYVLRGATPPADLFDPDRERAILEVMVREGPLVDGVTGKQTATVDGLSWDEYIKPMLRIRDILHS